MKLLEMAISTGINPKWAASTAGGEYHSSCPACGGRDRFIIQPDKQQLRNVGFFFCRRCGINGDIISFAMKFMNMNFKQAADYIGMEVKFNHYDFSNHIPREIRREAEIPNAMWLKTMTEISTRCHENLINGKMEKKQEYLINRGITLDTIMKYKIGYIKNWFSINTDTVGLPEFKRKVDGCKGRLTFVPGITIPTWDSGSVVRMKIRADKVDPEGKFPRYKAISGSMYGFSLLGNVNHDIAFAVESELDAYALLPLVEHKAFVVAVGSNIKNPDYHANHYLSKTSKIFVCSDKDEAGRIMYDKWKSIYQQSTYIESPEGKDIGEAFERGCDMNKWISSILNRIILEGI